MPSATMLVIMASRRSPNEAVYFPEELDGMSDGCNLTGDIGERH